MPKGPSKRLRFEILRRDDHTCQYCGRRAPDVALTVDHVIPVALGGRDEPQNLVAACEDCNRGKTSIGPGSPLVASVREDAVRWMRAMHLAATARTSAVESLQRSIAIFDEGWLLWTNANGDEMPRPADWATSIEQFLVLGLPLEVMDHLTRKAMTKPRIVNAERWSYFCGCCWRELEDLQKAARAMIGGGDGAD